MASKKDQQDEQPQTVVSEQTLPDGRTVQTEAQVLEVPQPEQPVADNQQPRNAPRGFVTLGRSSADGIPQFSQVDVSVRDRSEGA